MYQVHRLLLVIVSLTIGVLPTRALAGKSDYMLIVNNETNSPMTIVHTGDGCTDWDTPPAASTLLGPKTSTSYTFHRASRCSGCDGQVYFSYNAEYANDGGVMVSGTISTDYTADHEQGTQISQQGSQFGTSTFVPYKSGDQDQITVNIYDKQQMDIPTALSLGFVDAKSMSSAVAGLRSQSTIGSSTLAQALNYSPGLNVTAYSVTVPIWGFRTLKFEDYESSILKSGYVPSYAMKNLRKTGLGPFMESNGPNVSGATADIIFGMRLLAVANSAVPTSQFSSVGLDYQTAADPNWHTPGQYVYAFAVIPNAPIQGVSMVPGKAGEKQVQILAGTPISWLLRSTDNTTWMIWNVDTATWEGTDTVPSNNLDITETRAVAKKVRGAVSPSAARAAK